MLIASVSHITNFLCRTYMRPNISPELLSQETDTLHAAILEQLGSRSLLATTIHFRHDVFHNLFYGAGTASQTKGHILLQKCAFPQDWDQLVDKLGDGVKVVFPIKMRPFLSRSQKNHTLNGRRIEQIPCYLIEKLSISCLKQAISIL